MVSHERLSPEPLTDNDKLLGLLCYLLLFTGIPIGTIIVLLGDGKSRPFQRFHAINSLGLYLGLLVIGLVISALFTCFAIVTLGLGALLAFCFIPLAFLPMILYIWYGILAYQGKYFDIPVLTDWMRDQGWMNPPAPPPYPPYPPSYPPADAPPGASPPYGGTD